MAQLMKMAVAALVSLFVLAGSAPSATAEQEGKPVTISGVVTAVTAPDDENEIIGVSVSGHDILDEGPGASLIEYIGQEVTVTGYEMETEDGNMFAVESFEAAGE